MTERQRSLSLQQQILDSLVDDIDAGEPFPLFASDIVGDAGSVPIGTLRGVLKSLVEARLLETYYLDHVGQPREARAEDWDRLQAEEASPGPEFETMWFRITCRGRAAWRADAMDWQREHVDGRVEVDEKAGSVAVSAECDELAEQLLAEWLERHSGVELIRTSRRRESGVHFALHPGLSTTGIRVTYAFRRR